MPSLCKSLSSWKEYLWSVCNKTNIYESLSWLNHIIGTQLSFSELSKGQVKRTSSSPSLQHSFLGLAFCKPGTIVFWVFPRCQHFRRAMKIRKPRVWRSLQHQPWDAEDHPAPCRSAPTSERSFGYQNPTKS